MVQRHQRNVVKAKARQRTSPRKRREKATNGNRQGSVITVPIIGAQEQER